VSWGLGAAHNFALYHYVLNRARWNSRTVAYTLLTMILDRFLPTGPVVIGIDDTIERRWGRKIAAGSVYRDPVPSSHGPLRQDEPLRWLAAMAMLDASLFEPAPERRPGQNGRPPKKGRRLPKLAELN